tara:strand:- start:834 stop:1145 length:312 start_codon:yes stop_codon:yes gene_type:complete
MDVFPHITQRLDKRICIQFDQRPDDALLRVIKHHGSHRPIGNGQRAWQFASESWGTMLLDLDTEGYPEIAQQVRGIMKQWRVSDDEQRGVRAGSSEDSDDDEW